MSLVSYLFSGLNIMQTLLHFENVRKPQTLITLYDVEMLSRMPPEEQKKMKKLESIKDRICKKANISRDKVSLRFQEEGSLEAHGTSKQAVLGVGLKFFASYQMEQTTRQQDFKKFIDQLPDSQEQITELILNLKNRDYYCTLAGKYALDLNDDEIQFLMSHEILGHVKNNDSSIIGSCSTLLGFGALAAAEYIDHYLPFSGSKFVWHSIFYGLSRIGLQSVVVRNLERKADQTALDDQKENIEGGKRYFKRMIAINLLQKYNKNTSCIAKKRITSSGDVWDLSSFEYDPLSKRLSNCYSKY